VRPVTQTTCSYHDGFRLEIQGRTDDERSGCWSTTRKDTVVTALTKRTKPNSADFVRIECLTAVRPTRERIIYRKSVGTPVDFVAWEPFFLDKAGNVIIIPDASGVPEEITSEE
jgi:hypothetical protein